MESEGKDLSKDRGSPITGGIHSVDSSELRISLPTRVHSAERKGILRPLRVDLHREVPLQPVGKTRGGKGTMEREGKQNLGHL